MRVMTWTPTHSAGLAACCLLVAAVACGNNAQGEPPAGAAAAQRSPGDVVAVVDGHEITNADLNAALGLSLAKLEEQAHALRKQGIEELIAQKLIDAEATRRGVTVDALVAQEITSKVPATTDADIAAFVEANRSRIPGDPAAFTGQIRNYLTAQREQAQRAAFVATLREKAAVEVRLKAPPVYRAPVAADGFPTRGPADAPVTIVEFSDFHCPYCRAVQPTLTALLAKYPKQVRLVYRHLPLDGLHPQARRASEASWCANEQGKFWAFHDRVYAGASEANDAVLKQYATAAGLDLAAFDTCLASGRAKGPIQQDVEEGQKYGVNGTPGFFINGRFMSGNLPLDTFVSLVEDELGSIDD
jgi:protein-disulfide isomerase